MIYRRDFNGSSTFSAMPDSLELVPTLSDGGRHPEIAMAAYKPEVVITRERYEISARFQRILDIFDHAQHAEAIDNIVRYRPTSDRQPEIAMSANKPVFLAAIAISGCRPTSDNVGTSSSKSAMVENISVAFEISLLSHSVPELYLLPVYRPHCYFRLLAGCRPTSG